MSPAHLPQLHPDVLQRLSSDNSDTTLAHPQEGYIQIPKEMNMSAIPTISYSLRAHKMGIVVSWSILLTSSLVLPLILFYTFKYATSLHMETTLAVSTSLFGAPTLYSLTMRSWSLLRKDSTCRPLGSKGRHELDFFHYNFLIGFVVVTAIIVVGNVIVSARVSAIGTPVLITEVGSQVLIGAILASRKATSPIVVCSIRKGKQVRGGTYAITEDVIAVDSHGGRQFRQELSDRWEASPDIQRLFVVLDWAWGISATSVGAVAIGLVFGLENEDAAWAVGWAIPWGLAVVGGLGTLIICQKTLKKEKLRDSAFGRV